MKLTILEWDTETKLARGEFSGTMYTYNYSYICITEGYFETSIGHQRYDIDVGTSECPHPE